MMPDEAVDFLNGIGRRIIDCAHKNDSRCPLLGMTEFQSLTLQMMILSVFQNQHPADAAHTIAHMVVYAYQVGKEFPERDILERMFNRDEG